MTFVVFSAAGLSFGQTGATSPSEGIPDVCYAEVQIPEQTETITQQVIDTPEHLAIRITPAQYETVIERVLIQPAYTTYQVSPPVFEVMVEQVLEVPERTETRVIPAEYETYSERVLVRPAYMTWQPGPGFSDHEDGPSAQPGSGGDGGPALRQVEVPAQYISATRKRLKTPGKTETSVVPPIYRQVERRVIVAPAEIGEVVVPAEFDEVAVQRMIAPAQEEIIVIPATYKTVEKRRVIGGGGLEWREVLCGAKISPEVIASIQQALTQAGYPVSVDGAFGPATLRALEAYQRANGLPVGSLTASTLEALSVNAN